MSEEQKIRLALAAERLDPQVRFDRVVALAREWAGRRYQEGYQEGYFAASELCAEGYNP